MSRLTRRSVLAGLGIPGATLLAQMASRGVRPMPRGKASGLPFNAYFTNVSHQAGLVKPVVYGPPGRMDYILEAMGCGVAFLDYDNDGWLDIFVLSGTRKEGAVLGASNRLYKNNRDGTFTDVTEQAGLLRQGWAYGVTVADYNNDGFDDIFISCFGQNVLYRNNGNGTFTDVTQAAGLLHPGDRFTTGCSWVDYDRDGYLDLFVSHYVVFDFKKIPPTGKDPTCNFKGIPVNCGPRGLQPEHSSLYHNNGDGTFTEVTSRTGISKANPSYGLTVVAADFDGDGWQDIYVASDSKASQFFHNKHDGTFAEEGLERGVALNDDGAEQAGMGLGIGDFGLDGTLGVLKTHFTEDTPALYRNDGEGNFQDMTLRAGLGVETRYVSWGAGIQDFDNDGWPDIFWVTGSVYPEVEKSHPEYAFRTPRVLFRNLGRGQFEELTDLAGPAIGELHASRGVAFGDFDNDGDVDILIMNIDEPPSLLRNDVTGNNHWLKVLLKGTKSNRSAIGATVIASYGGKRQAQAVVAQSGYLSVNDRRLHFGLGESQNADLTIAWPSGARESYSRLAADRLYTIKEGSGIERSEEFKRVALPRS